MPGAQNLKLIKHREHPRNRQNSISDHEVSAETGTNPAQAYPIIPSVSSPLTDNYPAGFEALKETPVLYIECEETITHRDSDMKYTYRIVDAFGRHLYKAEEQSSRHGSSRPFELFIKDFKHNYVFTIRRPSNCCLCFVGAKCYGNTVEIRKMDGKIIGQIEQIWGSGFRFKILDEKGNAIMGIEGPQRINCCCPYIRSGEMVNLVRLDENNPGDSSTENKPSRVIGTFNVISDFASNDFGGIVFGMQFPLEFSCELKALVLGAGIMIDFTFCETRSSSLFTWYGSGFFTLIVFVLLCSIFLTLYLCWYLNPQ